MYCIQTGNLSYKYSGSNTVLEQLNMQVPYGAIYGFLGPNGSGKTTTLKLLLGLLKQQEGTIRIFEKPFDENRIDVLSRTGSLIEVPSIYGHLTAAENLRIWQKIYECPEKRISEVLDLVGLSHTGKKATRKFSLGMKQRLGIAVALLHKPELLILDEPTNGLDPNGISDIRTMLKQINSETKATILISSHLLSEIEKLVTHVGILNKGKLLFQDTLEALQSGTMLGGKIVFSTSDNNKSSELLTALNYFPVIKDDLLFLPPTDASAIAGINRMLINNNIDIYQVTTLKNDLESVFMDLTSDKS